MDRTPITNEQELEGKTIAQFYNGYGCTIIRFTDGTFTALCAESHGCDDEPTIDFEENPHYGILYSAGVINEEEWVTCNKREQLDRQTKRKEAYERLKQEFENQP